MPLEKQKEIVRKLFEGICGHEGVKGVVEGISEGMLGGAKELY